MTTEKTLKFVRMRRVEELTGIRRSWIYSLENQGRFPRRLKILSNTTVWIEEEVQAWMVDRVAQCRSPSLNDGKGAA